jgi:hypothetical protein
MHIIKGIPSSGQVRVAVSDTLRQVLLGGGDNAHPSAMTWVASDFIRFRHPSRKEWSFWGLGTENDFWLLVG